MKTILALLGAAAVRAGRRTPQHPEPRNDSVDVALARANWITRGFLPAEQVRALFGPKSED